MAGLLLLVSAGAAWSAPRRIGDGIISTPADEFGGAVTPDGKTIYFNRSVTRSYLYVICVSHLRRGRWSRPEVAPFSGTWRDSDPVLSPDGRRLYFASDRPWPGQKQPNFDIWVVDLDGPQPDVPRHIDGAVNSEQNEYFASEAADGTLYVASDRQGGIGQADVYRVKRVGDAYPAAQNLGEPVNAKNTATLDVLIAPDQSFLIMGTFGRSAGDSDLFLARNHDGVWSPPEPIDAVNTPAREYSPRFSHDERSLIFTSERGIETQPRGRAVTYDELLAGASSIESGLGNIYSIPLSELGLLPVKVPAQTFSPAVRSVQHQTSLTHAPGGGGATLLAPNVISTAPLAELGGTYSPDGNELYFVARTPVTSSRPLSVICVSRRVGGVWRRPHVAPFSGIDFDAGPAMSPDGKRLFFSSTRAVDGVAVDNADLWYVDRVGNNWSAAKNVGAPVNTQRNEVSPSVAADGTLYFASDRPGGYGSYDLYRARFVDGHYQQPENLGPSVNSEAAELTPFITADQHLLLFSAVGRSDMQLAGGNPYGRSDIYASEWNGAWTAPRRLPAPVNGVATESYPVLSRDGKTLTFTSERSPFAVPMPSPVSYQDLERGRRQIENGLANIYTVPAIDAGLDPR